MTRARLEGMPLTLLQELIQKESLDLPPQATREELIESLWDAYEEDRREKESLNNLIARIEQAKFALFEPDEPLVPEQGPVPELPPSYDDTFVGLLLRDPDWAFAYWDVKNSVLTELQEEFGYKGLILRVFDTAKPHLTPADQNSYFTINLTEGSGSQYINLPEAGRHYMVELRAQILEKETRLLARSRFIHNFVGTELPVFASGKEGENQKKLLELSGWAVQEARHSELQPEEIRRRIPQRIGDME